MEENPLEGWTVKSVDGEEVKSTQEKEKEILQEAVEAGDIQAEAAPATDDSDVIKVNLDEPKEEVVEEKQEEDAIQERETEEVLVQPETGSSEEVREPRDTDEEDTPLELISDSDEGSDDAVDAPEPVQEVQDVVQPQIELPEGIEKLVEFMKETGGSLEDFVDMNKNIEDMNPVDTLVEYYKTTKPHLDREEIEFLMDDKFAYDEETDDPREVKKKRLAFKEELYDAQKYLKGKKDKYYADLKFNSVSPEYQEAYEFHNKYKESTKQQEQLSEVFQQKTDKVFSDEFKGFDFKVGDAKYRYKVADVSKVKEYQSDLNNFVQEFLGEDGSLNDAAGYHKALFAAKNADKIAQHFYEQGRADAIKNSAAKSKNIDMKPRTDATSVVTKSGTKFKVVNDDSNTFKLNLKHY